MTVSCDGVSLKNTGQPNDAPGARRLAGGFSHLSGTGRELSGTGIDAQRTGSLVSGGGRLETIIRTLMDVAQAGVMRLNFQPTNLGALVDAGLELYGGVAAEKEIVVEKQFDGPVVVEADTARMRQVFANLLNNALKYTPHGGRVVITGEFVRDEAVISFRDNGPGVAPADLPRIWNRLYRGDKSRAEDGLGLGLSLVKAIVEAHGGRAEVRNLPDGGADFRVVLSQAVDGLAESNRSQSG